jgi:hypothetical protein
MATDSVTIAIPDSWSNSIPNPTANFESDSDADAKTNARALAGADTKPDREPNARTNTPPDAAARCMQRWLRQGVVLRSCAES